MMQIPLSRRAAIKDLTCNSQGRLPAPSRPLPLCYAHLERMQILDRSCLCCCTSIKRVSRPALSSAPSSSGASLTCPAAAMCVERTAHLVKARKHEVAQGQNCRIAARTQTRDVHNDPCCESCLQYLSCNTASPPFACSRLRGRIYSSVMFDMALQMCLVLLAKKHLYSSHLEASRNENWPARWKAWDTFHRPCLRWHS